MSEAAWQRQVEEIAAAYGWLAYHAPDNRPVTARSGRRYVQRVTPGFPDLVLLKDDRLIVAELKTERGRLSPEQKVWLAAFTSVGAEVTVWRPRNLPEVIRVLHHGAPPSGWES